MNLMMDKLKHHIGHKIVCVTYGDIKNPTDVCIECEDCGCVLVSAEDFDNDDDGDSNSMGIENLVMIERNYKGEYERGILAIKDFKEEFPDAKTPAFDSGSYTVKPMVHIWYKCPKDKTEVETFLIDMESGMPDSDVDMGNVAYLRQDLFSKECVHLFDKYKTESPMRSE